MTTAIQPAITPSEPAPVAVPPKMSSGFNRPMTLNYLMEEGERIRNMKIANRIKELLAIIPTVTDETQKIKLQCELKQLQLVELQRQVRMAFAYELRNFPSSLVTYGDRKPLLRPRRWLHPENVPTLEKIERQRREDGRQFLQKRRAEFLAAVTSHARNFWNFHNNKIQAIRKRTRQVEKYILNKERREQKERINALKKNDEAKYLELLKKRKNERLVVIIEQTDRYLREIGELVEKEQEKEEEELLRLEIAAERDPEKEAALRRRLEARRESAAKAREMADKQDDSLEIRKAYYTRIHKIQEEIKEQPKLLKGGKLKEYQMDGLQWLVSLYNNKLNGILADEMGLGKTIQTIALLCYLIENKANYGPFLIIAPLSTLSNWRNEFKHWAPDIGVVVYKGTPAERKKIQVEKLHGNVKFNVLLTTYEYVLKDKSALTRIKWNYIIVDEGHRMKNHACKLSQTLGKYYSAQHRIILTGTPLQNNLPELWSLLNFLLPNIFNSVETFEQWFNKPFEGTGEKNELNEEETLLIINRLHKLLRPFLLRRLKTDVEAQLPEKIEKVLKCDMSAYQRRMTEMLRESGVLLVRNDDGKVSHKSLSNTLMQLRKVANHPFLMPPFDQYEPPRDESLWRASGKFDLLDRILPKLKEAGHRVLLFSQMTAALDLLEVFLTMKNFKYLRLDGGTKAEERGALLAEFNKPNSEYFIFILSTRAGGLGLNLQSADTVIIFDSDWNPQMDLQAQDRAHRIGQKNEVLVLRLITIQSIEEKILERANFKLDMDAKVINAGKFNKHATASERKEYLLSLLKGGKEDDNDMADEVPNDKQINQMIARSEEEYKLFQQMDKQREIKEREEALRKGLPHPLPRLIQDDEIPPEFKIGVGSKEQKQTLIFESYGRGMRNRANVSYVDNSPDDWSDDEADDRHMDVDDADDDDDDGEFRRQSHKRKRDSTRGQWDPDFEGSSSKRQKADTAHHMQNSAGSPADATAGALQSRKIKITIGGKAVLQPHGQ